MAKNCGMLSTVVRAPAAAPPKGRGPGRTAIVAALLALMALVLFAGCHKKGKVEVPQARSPIRLVLLPANVPSGNADEQWLVTATPLLMAEAAGGSQDLEIVPLWESMPIAKETVADSSTITEENAAYVASRLAARWATLCDISPDKSGVSLRLDFIPSKPTLVPFRYEKKGPVGELNANFREAFNQFLRYLVAEPLEEKKLSDPASLRPVTEAINREYGWSVPPEPGKAEAIVNGFAQSHQGIAALIFNPNLYPSIKARATPKPAAPAAPVAPTPTSPPPAASPPAPSPGAASSPSPPQEASAAVSQPQPTQEADDDVVVPPPRSFTQKLASIPQPEPPPEPEKSTVPEATPSSSVPPQDPVPAAPNKASSPQGGGEFLLQVFATKGKGEAEGMIDRLKRAGFNPTMVTLEVPGKGTYYRIRLSGFQSRKAATAAGDKLAADGLIKEYWITR